MNGQKLVLILTWLFLICIILAISEICAYNYRKNNNELKDLFNIMFIANCVAATLITFNIFAYKLERRQLYQWGKYGFGIAVTGCSLLLFYTMTLQLIYCGPDAYRKCRDEYAIIPHSCLPLIPLSYAGYALTKILEKANKENSTEIQYHKVTLHFSVLTSIIILLTFAQMYEVKGPFDNTGIAIFSFYCVAIIALLFNVIVFATKKWNLYMPVVIGYGIYTFGNLIMFSLMILEQRRIHYHDWRHFKVFLYTFVPLMFYIICGIFGTILTIFSYKNGKKSYHKIQSITLPIKFCPKQTW